MRLLLRDKSRLSECGFHTSVTSSTWELVGDGETWAPDLPNPVRACARESWCPVSDLSAFLSSLLFATFYVLPQAGSTVTPCARWLPQPLCPERPENSSCCCRKLGLFNTGPISCSSGILHFPCLDLRTWRLGGPWLGSRSTRCRPGLLGTGAWVSQEA